jgi:hypothetical protein
VSEVSRRILEGEIKQGIVRRLIAGCNRNWLKSAKWKDIRIQLDIPKSAKPL